MTSITELDLSGLKCPLPVIKARKALARLSVGDELELLTTDPMAAIDIPHMCHEDGHILVSKQWIDERRMRFRVQKA
ncbi:MAG: sulfurtransferase TusA family protein [Ancalomicrobiaceae bacterium]|nr:sulfurtransferase TusA family protein [Ancalomicrobiaceae bacterium]